MKKFIVVLMKVLCAFRIKSLGNNLLSVFLILASFFASSTAGYCVLFEQYERDVNVEEIGRTNAKEYEAVCHIEGELGEHGTGTLIKKEGNIAYILTAAHVVANKTGNISAVFTLKNGNSIKCQAISALTPDFGPTLFLGSVNKDIAVLKCVVPEEYALEFNIEPLEIGQSDPGVLNRYEAKFAGCGMYGINENNEFKNDHQRRLGETNIIEYKKNDVWNLMTVLKAGNNSDYGFRFLDFDRYGKKLNTYARYMLSPFEFFQESLSEKHGLINPSLFQEEYLESSLFDRNVYLEIHPKQARIMPGDSGGPLFMIKGKIPQILGVIIQQKCTQGKIFENVKFKSFYFDHYTPVSYYKEWIDSILSNRLPEKTTKHIIFPNPHIGMFKGNTLEFTLKSGLRGEILFAFFGLYLFNNEGHQNRHNSIKYDKEKDILDIDGVQFDLSSYQSPQDAESKMMASGKFERVSFVLDKISELEVLKADFDKSLATFLAKKDYYYQDEFKIVVENFRDRYNELKKDALSDEELLYSIFK